MLRVAVSKAAQRASLMTATPVVVRSSGMPTAAVAGSFNTQLHFFHASTQRNDEAKSSTVEATPTPWWQEPLYTVPLGLMAAIPAIKYEWFLINEEFQLATCFIAFTAIVYKQFGGVVYEALEEDGKRILEEHNKIEDEIIGIIQHKINDVKMQTDVVKDAQDIKALKMETYQKLNQAGVIKPQYEFKAQMERILNMIANEESSMQEKAKQAFMEEATAAVKAKFASDENIKKQALTNAIAVLKGTKAGEDPVKAAYLQFFKEKARQAAKVDANKETTEAREQIVTKLNAIAKSEGFFFQFDANGNPKMVV